MIQKIKDIYRRYKNCKPYIYDGVPFAKVLIHNAAMWQEGQHFIVHTSHDDICSYEIQYITIDNEATLHINKPLPSGIIIGSDDDTKD